VSNRIEKFVFASDRRTAARPLRKQAPLNVSNQLRIPIQRTLSHAILSQARLIGKDMITQDIHRFFCAVLG
jgi:hypothetical protein